MIPGSKRDAWRDAGVAEAYEARRVAGPRQRRKHRQDAARVGGRLRRGPEVRTVLDLPAGTGRLLPALRASGYRVTGADRSLEMLRAGRRARADERAPLVQADATRLPFADGAFDAAFCKGALDHFDDPETAIEERARVTRAAGQVVLAIANFDSLACRVTRAVDRLREDWLALPPLRSRRGYDTPSDHFTRYELDLMCEQAGRAVEIEHVIGISLGWGMPGWTKLLAQLPAPLARVLLSGADRLARWRPGLADVIVLVGRPLASRGQGAQR
jgi:demethylmenaquinone methyltransferase/2-methoxy-6-polyprenyl-1,4-benzoquinol methylase